MPVSYTHLDVYKRQDKAHLVEMAHTNAVESLARESGRYAREEKLLDELAQVLGLAKPVSYTHLDVYKRQSPKGS